MSSSQILQSLLSIPARSRQQIGNWRNRVSSAGMSYHTLSLLLCIVQVRTNVYDNNRQGQAGSDPPQLPQNSSTGLGYGWWRYVYYCRCCVSDITVSETDSIKKGGGRVVKDC